MERGAVMTGIELIAAERRRQIEEEGWTAKHDAQHDDGELALAACYYAMPGHLVLSREAIDIILYPETFWPSSWDYMWAKRGSKTRLQHLVVAGALIAAEIDLLMAIKRAAAASTRRTRKKYANDRQKTGRT
jgi:hypothetical protein